MRLPSNGMSQFFISGSYMIFLLAASRTSFEGHSIHEKTIVSPGFASTARLKSVTFPSGTSSPQHSTWRIAPQSLNLSWNFCAAAL
jgi:hypothetical protein